MNLHLWSIASLNPVRQAVDKARRAPASPLAACVDAVTGESHVLQPVLLVSLLKASVQRSLGKLSKRHKLQIAFSALLTPYADVSGRQCK